MENGQETVGKVGTSKADDRPRKAGNIRKAFSAAICSKHLLRNIDPCALSWVCL